MESKHEKVQIIQSKTIITDKWTGEIINEIPLNAEIGRYRVQQCYQDVPSQTDQSQRDENNVSLLIQKYKPDELAMYLAAKNSQPHPIEDHDFSQEPSLQEALNITYRIQEEFDQLPKPIKEIFNNKPTEFLKFCENPKNNKQLEIWGLAKHSKQSQEALNAIKRDEADKEIQKLKKLKAQLNELESSDSKKS